MRAQHENRQARDDPWVQKKVNFYCTRTQVDSCFGSRLVCSGGLIHFTDELEEISPYKFVNVSAPLEFALKLSSGTQQSNFTYVP